MLISLASVKGAPGTTTSAHVLAAVWPAPVLLADADPAGSDLLYRLRTADGLPLLGMPRPEQATAIASNWGAVAARLRTARDVLCDVGRLIPGSPSLPIAMSSDLLLLVTRPGVDAYAHLRDRLRWILEETAHRAERPDLGILLIAPWKNRHEAGDLHRLLGSSGVDVPVVGTLADDPGAADSLAGRRPRPLRRTLLVRSARAVAASIHRPDQPGRLAARAAQVAQAPQAAQPAPASQAAPAAPASQAAQPAPAPAPQTVQPPQASQLPRGAMR